MGKPKTVDMSVNLEELEAVTKPAKAKKGAKEMAKAQTETVAETPVVKSTDEDTKEREKVDIQAKIEGKITANQEGIIKKASQGRSKTYISARRLIDKTKTYPLKKAVELVIKTSYSQFAGTIVADLITKDDRINVEVAFPHATGRSTRVAIATDELLQSLEKGIIDFDILVAAPDMMAKIAKYARLLGPKGLMPNPKNNTVTPNPEKRAKELASGKTTVKTEKKAPLMHVVVGKTTQPETELVANVTQLVTTIGTGKIRKLTLSATMSPGIKVDLSEFQAAS